MNRFVGHCLPTGNRENIASTFSLEYADLNPGSDMIAYVLHKPERSRPTRIYTSHGGFMKGGSDEYAVVGDEIDLYDDQSGKHMGVYAIVGVVADGVRVGEVPNRKLSHGVAK